MTATDAARTDIRTDSVDGPTVGVVVPAYRPDVDVLSAYIDAVVEAVNPDRVRVELDTPEQSVQRRLAGMPATVAVSQQRRGKGRAITEGFDVLDTDVLVFADADGATPAPDLRRVVDAITAGGADVAVGSRRHPDAMVETPQSRARVLMGDSFAWLARRTLDVSLYDYQCGAKALTASAWEEVRDDLTEAGFAWDVELLAFAGNRDLQVQEVPITWFDHPDSTVPPVRTAFDLGGTLLRTRHRTRRKAVPRRVSTGFTEGLATLLEDHPQHNE